MRLFPSSKRVATIGGYVVGGHAGIGAVRHGVLADGGNILALRVLTVEENPQALELRLGGGFGTAGQESVDAVDLVHFSFGTAGVVTEVEMPSTTSWAWRDVAYTFDDLERAAEFALAVTLADGLDVKNVHPVSPSVTPHLTPLQLPADRAAALCMVAPHSYSGLGRLARSFGGREALHAATGAGPRDIPFFEYTWGHTVWWVRKGVPQLATVIALLPEQDPIGTLRAVTAGLGSPLWVGISCKRFAGRPALQLALCVDGAVPGRLEQAAAVADEAGCLVADTHRPVLGHTSIYAFGDAQREFKQRVDPYGLLNPGKLDGVDATDTDATLSNGLPSQGFSSRR